MTSSEDALKILKLDREYAFGEQEGFLLGVWRGQPTEASFQERGRYMVDLAARHPGRCGYLEVIETTSKPPSPAARKVAADVLKEIGKSLPYIGMVIEGNELRATLVRAVIAGMTLLVRSDQSMRVDKDLSKSALWVCTKLQQSDTALPPRLVAGIERLRSGMPRG